MAKARQRNNRLIALIAEARWSHAQLASAFVRVAVEHQASECLSVGRSHVSHWVRGTQPSGRAPALLREALSRRLGRHITSEDLGMAAPADTAAALIDWSTDTLTALADLGSTDLSMERRRLLSSATYSVAGLALPDAEGWQSTAESGRRRSAPLPHRVGRGQWESVRDMVRMFSRMDQRRGGGHARTAVVQYLTSEVAGYLTGSYSDDRVRRDMFSTASELAYLSGWMAFDNAEHFVAQQYFTLAVKLAAEADDAPMTGHVLRAMAHQAVDLGHFRNALTLANASVSDRRYTDAVPRERALFGVILARSLAAVGDKSAAAKALLRAEKDLASAQGDADEPGRVFFFQEASLAHETACTLRDCGDSKGAVREFRRSVRTRKAEAFTRTHAVTLGYLGSVHVREGNVEEACGTWARALDVMDGVYSGRARQTARHMRTALSPFHKRGVKVAAELDARAAEYLSATTRSHDAR